MASRALFVTRFSVPSIAAIRFQLLNLGFNKRRSPITNEADHRLYST